jgi:GH15 family glucan-1,4-alpha-glucosidase
MMRTGGYVPIEDYAAIGDGRTAALVARDGGIDWLCLPDFDSPSTFGRILDADRGGAFELAPLAPFETERSYVGDTNVLATTFRTAGGTVRVTDALALADRSVLSPLRELLRRVECLSGVAELAWSVAPRFDYGRVDPRLSCRAGTWVLEGAGLALAVGAWGAGEPERRGAAVAGRFTLAAGESALLGLSVAHHDPLVFDTRPAAERRLERTLEFWTRWSARTEYDGPWRDLVVRSALALKLLVFAPSAALVAAPTTSLPEWIGGKRNWDYRYTWVRDAAFSLVALMRLGHHEEARSFFWWLSHATALTLPRLNVLYRLSGSVEAHEEELGSLEGYRGSGPVRVGNGAASQLQLDVYGTAIDAFWLYACENGGLGAHEGGEVAGIVDWVAANWRRPDSGIWEVRSAPMHFTHSLAMCWVALDRACKLAARGLIPDRSERWRREAGAIREFLDTELWDAGANTYVRGSASRDLDASLLLLPLFEYTDPRDARMQGTVDAVERELREGLRVHRYRSDDGVGGEEGAFLACSFWLAAALAKSGRVDDAAELMDELATCANDVGLYAEELAPDGSFLGNFPQALTHLALVAAVRAIEEAS